MEMNLNLKRMRKRTGISQQDLAASLNVSQAAISRYEAGDRIPKADVIFKLARLFEMNPGDVWKLFAERKEDVVNASTDVVHRIRRDRGTAEDQQARGAVHDGNVPR